MSPVFIRTRGGDNYRIKGDKIRLRWRLAKFFGLLIHCTEDPTENDLYIAGGWVAHLVYINQAALDAVMKAQQAAQDAAHPHGDKPRLFVPGKKPN
jgi:hypothetical protein